MEADSGTAAHAIAEDPEDPHAVQAGGITKRRPVFKLAESFTWGCCSVKYRRATASNKYVQQLQADCPRASHKTLSKKGNWTTCTFTLPFETRDEMRYTKRKLKHWLIMGMTCNTRADHHKQKLDVDNWCVPNEDDLDDQMRLALPMGREETDCEASRHKVPRNKRSASASSTSSD